MIEHDEHIDDEQVEPDEQVPGAEPHTPSGDTQSTPEPNVDREDPLEGDAPAGDEVTGGDQPVDDHETEAAVESIDELDETADATPVDAATETLRDALGTMREEADRIATLGTGEEQVAAAEKFAEDAGTLDEQVGAAARDHDGD